MARQRPLPKWVYQDKLYDRAVREMEEIVDIASLEHDPPRMLIMATRIRQSAGAMVRDALLRSLPSSLAPRALVARSLAWCVWRQDYALAGVLRFQFPWVQKHCITQGSKASLVDPSGFCH
eukprot:7780778-Pyramimonas_sp.AAC.1